MALSLMIDCCCNHISHLHAIILSAAEAHVRKATFLMERLGYVPGRRDTACLQTSGASESSICNCAAVLHCMQAAEDQQGLQASDLKAQVLKEVVDAQRRAKPNINTSIYRHNKAKGPNPMAFKKKKRKEGQRTPAEEAVVGEPKEKRARKRRKSSQNQDATKAD